MKKIGTICLLCLSIGASAQLLENGSFETEDGATLAGWVDQCGQAISAMDVPGSAGVWSLGLAPGNTQGCFPGYFYQTVNIDPNLTYQLSGWVKTELTPLASIGFGRLDELGQINVNQTDTTSAPEWTYLESVGTFAVGPNDMPAVVLSAGLTGGPSFPGYAYFDQIELELSSNTTDPELPKISTYPNPTTEEVHIFWSHSSLQLLEIRVVDVQGQVHDAPWMRTDKKQYSLALKGLPAGLYVLHFTSDGGRFFKKVVKVQE